VDPQASTGAPGFPVGRGAPEDLRDEDRPVERNQGQTTLAPAASAVVIRESGHVRRDRILFLRWECSSYTYVTASVVTSGPFLRTFRETVILAPDGEALIRINGALDLSAVASAGVAGGNLHFAILTESFIETAPPFSASALGLVRGGVGVPGAWTPLGWLPPRSSTVEIYTLGAVEIGYDDGQGTPLIGPWSVTTVDPQRLHPPHLRLIARHPGDAADSRNAVATWK
jgi:hypothetical protein